MESYFFLHYLYIFSALATVPKTKCDATKITHCSFVPGGTVYIRLMNNATGYLLELFKDLLDEELIVFTVKEGEVKIQEEYRNRTAFVIKTGMLMMYDVEEDDAGQYNLDVYTPEGTLVITRSFTLQMKGAFKK